MVNIVLILINIVFNIFFYWFNLFVNQLEKMDGECQHSQIDFNKFNNNNYI